MHTDKRKKIVAESSGSMSRKILIGVMIGVPTTVVVDVVSNFSILAVLRWTWAFLTDEHSLPGWLLVAVSTVAIVGLVVFAIAWSNSEARIKAKSLIPFMHYTTDTFYGVKWRWSYSEDGKIINLTMFCLECDIQLASCPPLHRTDVNTCGRCGTQCLDSEMSILSACNNVPLEIQRNIRAGDY